MCVTLSQFDRVTFINLKKKRISNIMHNYVHCASCPLDIANNSTSIASMSIALHGILISINEKCKTDVVCTMWVK